MSASFLAAASVRATDARDRTTWTTADAVWARLPSTRCICVAAGTAASAAGTAASVAGSVAGGAVRGAATGAMSGYSAAGIVGGAVGGTGGAVLGASSGAAFAVASVAATCAGGVAASTAYVAGDAARSCAAYLADKSKAEYRIGDLTRSVLGKLGRCAGAAAALCERSTLADAAVQARALADRPAELPSLPPELWLRIAWQTASAARVLARLSREVRVASSSPSPPRSCSRRGASRGATGWRAPTARFPGGPIAKGLRCVLDWAA